MTIPPLAIPLVRAAAWFETEPPDGGADGFLDLARGSASLDLGFVEPLQRRRLSRLARACFHCANRVGAPGDGRVVFASRHGEAERTLAILHDLAAGVEVSPTQFSMSVHNAVPGLWSILRGNRAAACAVAAGPESFGWGLVEALAAFRADPASPVLYVYGDDVLPDPWADPVPRGVFHALALLLGNPPGRRCTLELQSGPGAATVAEPDTLQSLHFLRALRAGPQGAAGAPWAGPGGTWAWHFA